MKTRRRAANTLRWAILILPVPCNAGAAVLGCRSMTDDPPACFSATSRHASFAGLSTVVALLFVLWTVSG